MPAPPDAQELMARFPDLDTWVSESEARLLLSRLVVPAGSRNRGRGSEFMAALCDLADRAGKRVELTPVTDFGAVRRRLVEFYKRFGFVQNKGRNRDFEVSEAMYRRPLESARYGADRTAGERDGIEPDDEPGSGVPLRDDDGEAATGRAGEGGSRARRAMTERLDQLQERRRVEPPDVGI